MTSCVLDGIHATRLSLFFAALPILIALPLFSEELPKKTDPAAKKGFPPKPETSNILEGTPKIAQPQVIDSAQPDPQKLVNRRVLLLDFHNTQRSSALSYLEISVPEAMIEPLQKTQKFEIMNRQIWSKLLEQKLFTKEDAFNDLKAAEIGRTAEADIVVIGKFIVVGNNLEIQGKAIDVSTGMVQVSRAELGKTDGTMFETINSLARNLSTEMATKLPPLPQQIIFQERQKYKEKPVEKAKEPAKLVETVTFNGMLWRTAVLPGWGHLYAGQKRGWVYAGLFAGVGGMFFWSQFNYSSKQSAYDNATADFDAKYTSANSAHRLRGYMSFAFIGVIVAAWTDILIFGKNYTQSSAVVAWDIYGDPLGGGGVKWSMHF